MNTDTTTKTYGYSELSDAVRCHLVEKYAKRLQADESQTELNSVLRHFSHEMNAIGLDVNQYSVAFSIATSGEEGASFSGSFNSDVKCPLDLVERFGQDSGKFLEKAHRQLQEIADGDSLLVTIRGCSGFEAMPSNMEVKYIASEYDEEAGGFVGVMYTHNAHCEVQTRLVELVNMVSRELYRRIMTLYRVGSGRLERQAEEYYSGKRFLLNGTIHDEEWLFVG